MRDLFSEPLSPAPALRTHLYTDGDGRPIYRIRRSRASWTTEHPDGEGWARGYDGPKVLYRLPDLLAAPDLPVWITEGERDADTLAQLGLLTTTVANSSWRKVDCTPLAGRAVVVAVDCDATGWKRGRESCTAAKAAGATVLRVVRPMDGHKDITDHVAAGQSLDLLWPVNLDRDPAPLAPDTRSAPPRSVYGEKGTALSNRSPLPALLALIQRGELAAHDLAVYELYEWRAGRSSDARLTIKDAAWVLGLDRHQVGESLQRLQACHLLAVEKRGRWRVHNPAWPYRRGDFDPTRSLTFRDRPPSPSSSTSPSTSPGSGVDRAIQAPDRATRSPASGSGATTPHDVSNGLAVLQRHFPDASLTGR